MPAGHTAALALNSQWGASARRLCNRVTPQIKSIDRRDLNTWSLVALLPVHETNGQCKKLRLWLVHAVQEWNCKAEKTADPPRIHLLVTNSKYTRSNVVLLPLCNRWSEPWVSVAWGSAATPPALSSASLPCQGLHSTLPIAITLSVNSDIIIIPCFAKLALL